jgi:hypothetical protein
MKRGRAVSFVVGVGAGIGLPLLVLAHDPTPSMPDPALTPGAIASASLAEICAPGYARSHRVWYDKASTLQKYGLPPSDAHLYEDDDRVPVCLGGDNASPLNHWPQRWSEARDKDALEWRVCREVCEGGMSLDRAHLLFLGDWRQEL